MKRPCPASISGMCLEMAEGWPPCPGDDCDREETTADGEAPDDAATIGAGPR